MAEMTEMLFAQQANAWSKLERFRTPHVTLALHANAEVICRFHKYPDNNIIIILFAFVISSIFVM